MAAGGERNIEINQFAIDVSFFDIVLTGINMSCLLLQVI